MPQNFRKELIESVDQEGRAFYANALCAVDTAIGREGDVKNIGVRVIKGIRQLQLPEARLTKEGLATADGEITDCSAAMVRNKNGQWERYSGKDSAHTTRIFSSYNPDAKEFSIWAEDDDGSAVVQPESFPASALHPKDGQVITAKIGGDMLEGVLEDGDLTAHIRECLRKFEKDVENIGLLLRHTGFHRFSDTRTPGQDGVNTLYSDGAQMHAMNERTILEWQNADIRRKMTMDSYRAGLGIGGEHILPNIEDLIYEIRVHTQKHGDVPLYFTSLTPRCLVTQRDVRTGAVQAEPKLWNKKHRPLRPWDTLATMGANVDMPPAFDGAVIRVGDRFTVVSEKTQWRQ